MLMAAVSLAAASSCSDPGDELTSVEYNRYFRPTELEAKVTDQINVTLSWHTNNAPAQYQAEFYTNESFSGTAARTETMDYTGNSVADCEWPLKGFLGETTYYVRLRAYSDSKQSEWVSTSFTTKAEQSLKAVSEADVTETSITVHWKSGIEVTHLTYKSETDSVSVPLDATAKADSSYTITNLQQATAYVITLWNNDYKRGTVTAATIGGVTPEPEPEPEGKTYTMTWTSGDVQRSWTVGSLTWAVTNDEALKVAVDANTQYFGTAESYEKFDARFKTGGTSGSKLAIQATLAEAGTLYVYARSGSSSADRALVFTKDGKEYFNQTLSDATAATAFIPEEGMDKSIFTVYSAPMEAGTYDVTFPNGSVNVYCLKFVTGSGTPDTPDEPDEPDEPVVGDIVYGTGSMLTFTEFAAGSNPLAWRNNDGLSLAAVDNNGKMACDANSQYFGTATNYINETTRLKSGGTAGSNLGFTVSVPKAGKLIFYMRTGSNSATRTVTLSGVATDTFSVGEANVTVGTVVAPDGTVTEGKNIYTPYVATCSGAGEVTLTFDGSINIYALEFQ